jgi:hypothetical protein
MIQSAVYLSLVSFLDVFPLYLMVVMGKINPATFQTILNINALSLLFYMLLFS